MWLQCIPHAGRIAISIVFHGRWCDIGVFLAVITTCSGAWTVRVTVLSCIGGVHNWMDGPIFPIQPIEEQIWTSSLVAAEFGLFSTIFASTLPTNTIWCSFLWQCWPHQSLCLPIHYWYAAFFSFLLLFLFFFLADIYSTVKYLWECTLLTHLLQIFSCPSDCHTEVRHFLAQSKAIWYLVYGNSAWFLTAVMYRAFWLLSSSISRPSTGITLSQAWWSQYSLFRAAFILMPRSEFQFAVDCCLQIMQADPFLHHSPLMSFMSLQVSPCLGYLGKTHCYHHQCHKC